MSKKLNFRAEYKKQLIEHFDNLKLYYDSDIIKSIMNKVAINSRNKYGKVDFEEELEESGIVAGEFFYKELGKKDTYNRINSRR